MHYLVMIVIHCLSITQLYLAWTNQSYVLFCLIHYSFTRVQFALVGQENQDANLGEESYIFFLSDTATGKAVCVCSVDMLQLLLSHSS